MFSLLFGSVVLMDPLYSLIEGRRLSRDTGIVFLLTFHALTPNDINVFPDLSRPHLNDINAFPSRNTPLL